VCCATKVLGCGFFLGGLLTFQLSIVSISLVSSCNFLCDLACIISLKKSSYVGLLIITSLIWLNICEKVKVKSKMCEGEFEVCAPLFCSIV